MKKVLIPLTSESLLKHFKLTKFEELSMNILSILVGCTITSKHSAWMVTSIGLEKSIIEFWSEGKVTKIQSVGGHYAEFEGSIWVPEA